VYDFNDAEMMNALRASIEEAQPVQSQEMALDYIGNDEVSWSMMPLMYWILVNKRCSMEVCYRCCVAFTLSLASKVQY
jgi:hypothetical protein